MVVVGAVLALRTAGVVVGAGRHRSLSRRAGNHTGGLTLQVGSPAQTQAIISIYRTSFFSQT